MIDGRRLARILEAYPSLRETSREIQERIAAEGTFFEAADRDVLFQERDFCTGFPMIVAGSARVVRWGSKGREIVLYHVGAGEFCLLSTVGILAESRHAACAVAEGRTAGAVLSPALFRELARSTGSFATDLFGSVARRVDLLVGLIEQISILSIDQRLALLILSRGPDVRATHQSLADEIGCARENVSRALGRFHREGIVSLGRGRVRILDPRPLTAIAATDDPPRIRAASRSAPA
ncbi:MAG TPA: Crp/Fnr family transcriptional regulator [Candidatus Polarisedimenticolaceae bacterium]|nr:Crp/Fnr family transcriptional regulator [Candidatus Polarisedimenticolaceae bacterium]